MSSPAPTPWAVTCPEHGRVYLTEREYRAQLYREDADWTCPLEVTAPPPIGPCGQDAEWDDENYEARVGSGAEATTGAPASPPPRDE